jgi:hypothetical protein
MILALLVLVPILVLMLWAFLHFSPKLDNQRRIIYFNLAVLILGFLV